ncbi:putative Uncharacterized AIM2 family protein C30D10.14 [Glarea lozoyensis 74030]|uniref:Putative Uncharacterized AIM2 family protein C30D10.14 n=1 Tax=Glarea lozoyensis (strain ATCC 74030 / MF5533) TaxID=1104152 RepID=H0EKJ5_GLAL7|nr:putative Uncharacterized AIM2 family protein C30D10.14 [Glarea lozoyensis 74030]
MEYLSTTAAPATAIARIPGIIASIEAFSPTIKTWGVVGFCWGGKIISVATSTTDTPFKAAAECHPAFVDPKEALGIKIPLCMLPSGDEPVEDVKKFQENLSVDNHVETFADMIHGWMTAKGDFEDERKRGEYERGYKRSMMPVSLEPEHSE